MGAPSRACSRRCPGGGRTASRRRLPLGGSASPRLPLRARVAGGGCGRHRAAHRRRPQPVRPTVAALRAVAVPTDVLLDVGRRCTRDRRRFPGPAARVLHRLAGDVRRDLHPRQVCDQRSGRRRVRRRSVRGDVPPQWCLAGHRPGRLVVPSPVPPRRAGCQARPVMAGRHCRRRPRLPRLLHQADRARRRAACARVAAAAAPARGRGRDRCHRRSGDRVDPCHERAVPRLVRLLRLR